MNDEWPLIDGNEVTLAMWQLTIYLSFYALIISSNFFFTFKYSNYYIFLQIWYIEIFYQFLMWKLWNETSYNIKKFRKNYNSQPLSFILCFLNGNLTWKDVILKTFTILATHVKSILISDKKN